MSTALRVGGWYTVLAGVLLLFPPLAAAVFGRLVLDAAVESGWGAALIIIGAIILVAASDVGKYGGLVPIIVGGFLLSAIDLVYFWMTGAYTARNVLVPVLLNIVFAGWIWTSRSKV